MMNYAKTGLQSLHSKYLGHVAPLTRSHMTDLIPFKGTFYNNRKNFAHSLGNFHYQ